MANIETTQRIEALFERISSLIDHARTYAISAVKIAEVKTRYEVGRYIFEDEQQGERAKYGEQVLKQLSARLMERYGADWTYDTLKRCRFFYQSYANASIGATPLPQLENHVETSDSKEVTNSGNAVAPIQLPRFILSWSHYLVLMRIENIEARSFYELECAQQQWSVKQDFENPTIGILLCSEKSDALVELTLPENSNVYASQYSLYLPDKTLLQRKLKEWREELAE